MSGPTTRFWFTDYRANAIGRITLAGKLTQFPTGQPYGEPSGIVTGPDNAFARPWNYAAAVKELAKRAGIKTISLHDLRDTQASLLAANGVPPGSC